MISAFFHSSLSNQLFRAQIELLSHLFVYIFIFYEN